jgi:hypothetical protein
MRAHENLADCCLQLLSKTLKQNICDTDSPGEPATNVDSGYLEMFIPQEVQYAYLNWI